MYDYSDLRVPHPNAQQVARYRINDTFGRQNIMALVVPAGDKAAEAALLKMLSERDDVNYAAGLSDILINDTYALSDSLTPRETSDLLSMTYEQAMALYGLYAVEREEYTRLAGGLDGWQVPLMDLIGFAADKADEGVLEMDDDQRQDLHDAAEAVERARAQMSSDDYSRMVLNVTLPVEGEETAAFLDMLHDEAARYYDREQVYVIGDPTSARDLKSSFKGDNILISVLTALIVLTVLLFTFRSLALPVLLIMVIQSSIWINFAFPALSGGPVFFMSYLVVTSIQMGANIDYAIVIAGNYEEMLDKTGSPQKAVLEALNRGFPTVMTSGTILLLAGVLVYSISSEEAIVSLGKCLASGTGISLLLVMLLLPQLILLGNALVEKTRFRLPLPQPAEKAEHVSTRVDGHVHGYFSGKIDAEVHGTIRGRLRSSAEQAKKESLTASAAAENPPEPADAAETAEASTAEEGAHE